MIAKPTMEGKANDCISQPLYSSVDIDFPTKESSKFNVVEYLIARSRYTRIFS